MHKLSISAFVDSFAMTTRTACGMNAAVIAGTLALSACTPTPQASQPGLNQGSVATVAWNQAFYSVNGNSSFGNATANNNILYMPNDAFNYYEKDRNLVPNASFGTYEKPSDDPLTVKQTLADTAVWSDCVPVTPADLLLNYAAQSGLYNNYEAKTDADTGSTLVLATLGMFCTAIGWELGWRMVTIDRVGADGA